MGLKIPPRKLVKQIVKATLEELAKERLRLYMEAFDEESVCWETTETGEAWRKRIRADALEGTWAFLHPALTNFYDSNIGREAWTEPAKKKSR